MTHTAKRRLLTALAGALAPLACAGEGTGDTSATVASVASVDTTLTTAAASTAGTTAATTGSAADTSSESGTTGAAPPTYCSDLDVHLVVDPDAKIFDPDSRLALHSALDRLVKETGATVRVHAGTGSEFPLPTACLADFPDISEGPVIVWGEAGKVALGTHGALNCLLTDVAKYQSDFDEGDYLLSGLLFPILEEDAWPTPGATGLAVLIGADDDQQGGMYARPGMASEAFLRIVADGDRRRAAAFTYGQDADELELFALSFGDAHGTRSRHYDRQDTPFTAAIAEWSDQALAACDDFDRVDDIPEPEGCKRIDILFVIDGSGSMSEEQRALAGLNGEPPVFAEFTDALLAELTDVEDFHVGVVSTQLGVTRLHTHRDYPAVPESADTECGLPPGQRWIVGPSPELEPQFACIGATLADVDEFPTYNAAKALADPENAGFLRDDSLLFVVIVTDEDTQDWSEATMTEIRALLLDAVDGDLARLVVLAIIGDQGTFEMPKTVCSGPYGGAAPGRRITSIVRSLRERGHTQDICAGSMTATFESILGEVVSACEAFTPIP